MAAKKSLIWSKLNWLGAVQIALAAATTVGASPDAPDNWRSWALLVSGVLTIVLRSFFTDTTTDKK
jgi:hypothetical protein